MSDDQRHRAEATTVAPVKRSIAAQALFEGRAALTTSFRMHRARGAFCHDGWCQQCKVTLDDGRVVLACQEPAGSAKIAPQSLRDWCLRQLGKLAERQPPWFYEGRFLRPKFLRQAYLHVLRQLSGAKRLPDEPAALGGQWHRLSCDVLVVGGGVAGRAAAAELSRAGRSVIVVDARARSACVGNSDENAPFRTLAGTLCVGLYEEPRRALCVDARGSMLIEHGDLVVATGAYDRILAFPNNDLPGIVGARALEQLIAQSALAGTLQIGVYGEPLEVKRALRALAAVGLQPRWIAGPSTLRLAAPDVKVFSNSALVAAHGKDRIRGVELAGSGMQPCDLLVLGFSQPGYELQLQRHAVLHAQGLPRKLIADVSRTGVLVVGEAAGYTTGDAAEDDARSRVASWLDGRAGASYAGLAPVHEALRGQHADSFICPCEDVRVRDIGTAIREGDDDIELIKRHTGAATGPCQGKLCHANLMDCLAEHGVAVRLPTQRPLVRPVLFARFAGAPEE